MKPYCVTSRQVGELTCSPWKCLAFFTRGHWDTIYRIVWICPQALFSLTVIGHCFYVHFKGILSSWDKKWEYCCRNVSLPICCGTSGIPLKTESSLSVDERESLLFKRLSLCGSFFIPRHANPYWNKLHIPRRACNFAPLILWLSIMSPFCENTCLEKSISSPDYGIDLLDWWEFGLKILVFLAGLAQICLWAKFCSGMHWRKVVV